MSSYKHVKFTETELQALNRWTDLQDFGLAHSETVDANEATRILTVEEIETIQKQAYDEAFQQGREAGFAEGKEQGFNQGQQQGYEQGHQQGYQESLHLLQSQAAELVRLMETLAQPFQNLDQEVEAELVKLAIAIASQIIRREIKLDPGQIVGVIRSAVKALPLAQQKITVNLHPEDAELVKTALSLEESVPSWHLAENPLISRGGCTIETDCSGIDATVEHRLAQVIANLLGGDRQQDYGL